MYRQYTVYYIQYQTVNFTVQNIYRILGTIFYQKKTISKIPHNILFEKMKKNDRFQTNIIDLRGRIKF